MNSDKPTAKFQPPEALPPGTRLGEFELRSVLGVGGFGIVYLAFDHALEREVAVKEYMPASLAGRTETMHISLLSESHADTFARGLRSFINEARLLARFDHPSLVKVYRFWEENSTAYMAMPLYRGQTLKAVRLEMAGSPDEAWLRTVLEPLLGAIDRLHQEGVYHRDIAPDNILIEAGGHPVLLDFGAARRVLNDKSQNLTAILKPAYAPIEQYGESGSVKQGPWTDIYSLGATLHFLLLGRPPAPAAARAVHDDATALTTKALPGCSEDFLLVIDWMLAPRPIDRPQSVAALREVLAGHAQVPVWTPRATPVLGQPVPGPERSNVTANDPFADLGTDRTFIKQAAERGSVAASPGNPANAYPPLQPPPPVAASAAAPTTAAQVRLRMNWLAWLRSLWNGSAKPRGAPALAKRQTSSLEEESQPLRPSPQTGPDLPERTQLFEPPSVDSAAAEHAPDRTVFVQQRPAAGRAAGALRVALTVQRSEVQSYVNRVYPLAEGETVIGRAGDGLALPDPSWSARHARIVQSADGIVLSDLDSRNGTYVNGIRLVAGQECRLHLGALIQIGSTVLSLSLPDSTILPDLSGVVIAGRYVLKECLQSSPKGVVYRAEKKDSGVAVAIKILSPDYASYPGYRERFSAEAQIASKLQHPHICRLDDYGETELVHGGFSSRVPYSTHVIMGGGSLADRHREYGRLPIAAVQGWLTQAADALDYAHGNDVIHGNLKPSTICFDGQSNLYVTDFAIAGRTRQGQAMVGTPAYMAPEQWEGKEPTGATDQYALAAIVYTLITGFKPYDGQEDPVKREHNLMAPPPALHVVVSKRFKADLPPALSRVVNKALAEKPADRYESAGAFAKNFALALRPGLSRSAKPVFLSYRREVSKHLAIIVEEQLNKQHGIASFMDTQGLDAAGKFPDRIARAIHDCQIFVCILGPTTLQSSYVLREISLAHELGKRMIPVFQENDPPALDDAAEAAVRDLLIFEGVPMADGRPRYLRTAITELAERIEATLAELERDASP